MAAELEVQRDVLALAAAELPALWWRKACFGAAASKAADIARAMQGGHLSCAHTFRLRNHHTRHKHACHGQATAT